MNSTRAGGGTVSFYSMKALNNLKPSNNDQKVGIDAPIANSF